jgi:hypothetical protein
MESALAEKNQLHPSGARMVTVYLVNLWSFGFGLFAGCCRR